MTSSRKSTDATHRRTISAPSLSAISTGSTVLPSDFDMARPWGSSVQPAEAEIAGEGVTRLVVQAAHGGADLIVVKRGDVFHEEVEEARVALEDGEELQGVGGVGRRGN